MPVYHLSKRVTKKLKEHTFVVRIDMFKIDVGVFFAPEDVVSYMNNTFDMNADVGDFSTAARAEAGAFFNEEGVPAFYILFHSYDPQIGVVAHECVHSAIAICTQLGVTFDRPNDETLAYMVDYLTQNIIDEIRAYDARSKKDDG